MSQRAIGLSMAVTTGLCWAILAIALRQAAPLASTGTIVWFRMIVAFLLLILFYSLRAPKKLEIFYRAPFSAHIAGLCLAANYFAYMRGLELTSAGNAQIMIQLGPLILLLMGIFFFNEIPSRLQAIGILSALVGFALFFWDQILLTLARADRYIEGNLWIVFAAVTWAGFAGIQKRTKGRFSPQQYNMLIYAVCTLALWPLAKVSELNTWSLGTWILMIALGLNTLIAYGAFAEALARIPASHVSVIVSSNPLLTLFLVSTLGAMEFSWIQYEEVGWRGWTGALAVVLGVILTVWRKDRFKRIKV